MDMPNPTNNPRRYDRAFLLSTEKRNQVMELWEIQRYGSDSFADADYVSIYGMSPSTWYQRGIRLLARTTVECTRDSFADLIGKDVARVLERVPTTARRVAIDPFAGSCNTLYWILRHMQGTQGIAFELDQTIFDMTSRNVAALDAPITLLYGDYRLLLSNYYFPAYDLFVIFVAPPWGNALDAESGLDLRRTQPPVPEIVDFIESVCEANPILYVIQVHQHVEPTSLNELVGKFDWSELHIYDINAEGMKQGVLLGTVRWKP